MPPSRKSVRIVQLPERTCHCRNGGVQYVDSTGALATCGEIKNAHMVHRLTPKLSSLMNLKHVLKPAIFQTIWCFFCLWTQQVRVFGRIACHVFSVSIGLWSM